MNEHIHAILGRLILTPHFIEISDLSIGDFPPGREREVFRNIVKIWEDQKPNEINVALLAERIDGNGAYSFVNSLLNEAIPLTAEAFQLAVSELKRKNLTTKILKKIEKQAKGGKLNLDEIEGDLTLYRSLSGPRLDISTTLKTGSELQTLNIDIKYLIDGFVAAEAINLLYGRGGLGKTILSLQSGKAIAANQNFLDLETQKRTVIYIDYENSLPLLVDRIRKMEIKEMKFWHLSSEPKPPRLDTDEYKLLFELPPESLLIFDSLRAAHLGDENSSKDMALIMGRLKELREEGFTILVNHHTGKADDRIYKGSTAISDMADHVLGFNKVRKKDFEIIDDDQEPGLGDFYRLGTREKTRFKPFHIYLHFSPESYGFVKADDPDEDELQQLKEIIGMERLCQNEIFQVAREGLGIKKKGRIVNLLNKGEGRLWHSYKDGRRVVYEII